MVSQIVFLSTSRLTVPTQLFLCATDASNHRVQWYCLEEEGAVHAAVPSGKVLYLHYS